MIVDFQNINTEVYNYVMDLAFTRSYKSGDSLDFAVPSEFWERCNDDPEFINHVSMLGLAYGQVWRLDPTNSMVRVSKYREDRIPMIRPF